VAAPLGEDVAEVMTARALIAQHRRMKVVLREAGLRDPEFVGRVFEDAFEDTFP
jgi:hypothetical protein